MFDQKYLKRLEAQKKAGLYRNPPEIMKREGRYIFLNGKKLLNFASNDYLGLGSSDSVKETVAKLFQKYGSSSSSSRLVTGNYSTIREAEKAFALHFGYEDALFFPSGYQANIGVISTLFSKGDLLIFDKHVHSSTVKGISMSGAAFTGYRHNSVSHLEKKLVASCDKDCAVITESLFSMDGDFSDFEEIKRLKSKYGFLCIADEAHSYGAIGEHGKGVSGGVADIGIGTFGKAFGLFGAFVLLPSLYREYLVNFASPYIYTTSLPEAHGAAVNEILELIDRADDERERLKELSCFMKKSLQETGFKTEGDAHILSVEIGDEEKTVEMTRALQNKGFFTFPARFPTVPIGLAIIRISMTAMHTKEDVLSLCNAFKLLNA